MNTIRFSALSVTALFVGLLACHSVAAPEAAQNSKNGTTLIDEAEQPKAANTTTASSSKNESATKEESVAQPAPETKKAACEPAPAKESSSFPVVPTIFASISTIAFIVLAIIF